MSDIAVNPLRVVAGHRTQPVRWTAAALVAALLSLTVSWVHFAYVSSHWRDWWAYGLFFLLMGVFQAVFAPALLKWPNMWTALVGIAGNAGIVGMYVLSRTNGIPMGPHTGIVEPATAIDLSTTAGEIVLMAILLGMVGPRNRRWIINLLLVAGVALWVLRLTNRLP
jgi:peptidoglycan/LPS O-acetylase OafA/YrhL